MPKEEETRSPQKYLSTHFLESSPPSDPCLTGLHVVCTMLSELQGDKAGNTLLP